MFSLSLVPLLSASSMMVGKMPPSAPDPGVGAGDGEAGGEGEADMEAVAMPGRGQSVILLSEDDLLPECGKRLEREREAATAPHS